MKATLIFVGRTVSRLYIEGISDYESRINHYMPFNIKTIADLKNNRNSNEQQQKDKEGELILKSIESKDFVILLDEHGKEFSSVDFASWINDKMLNARPLTFIIGGPYGFSKSVYDRADFKMSLSPMTFNHQMVRLIFIEQLYRACTILRGEPYHHK